MKQKELMEYAKMALALYGAYCLYQRYQAQQAAAMGAIQMNPNMGAVHMGAVHMGAVHQMGMMH